MTDYLKRDDVLRILDHAVLVAGPGPSVARSLREALAALPDAPQQQAELVGRVEKYHSPVMDMAMIVWLGTPPPAGTLLYASPPPDDEAVALLREVEGSRDAVCFMPTHEKYCDCGGEQISAYLSRKDQR